MHHRRVVAAAEGLADLRQGKLGQLATEIHGDLASGDQLARARRTAQVINGEGVVGRGLGLDPRKGDLHGLIGGDEVLEDDLGEAEVDRLPVEAREGGDSDESAFELADVRGDAGGDVFEDLVGGAHPLLEGLFAQDGDPGL